MEADRRLIDLSDTQAGEVEIGGIAGGNIYNGVSSEHIVALLHELIGDTRQYRALDLSDRQRIQDEQYIHNSAVRAQIDQLQRQQRFTNRVLLVLSAALTIALVVVVGLLIDRLSVMLGLLIGVGVALSRGVHE